MSPPNRHRHTSIRAAIASVLADLARVDNKLLPAMPRVQAGKVPVDAIDRFYTGQPAVADLLSAAREYSRLSAIGASRIASQSDPSAAFACYAAALTHNVGEALMLRLVGDAFAHDVLDEKDTSLLRAICARTHESLGRRLLAQWDLSDQVVQVAGNHHGQAARARLDDTARFTLHAVNLGQWIAGRVGAMSGITRPLDLPVDESLHTLNLDRATLYSTAETLALDELSRVPDVATSPRTKRGTGHERRYAIF